MNEKIVIIGVVCVCIAVGIGVLSVVMNAQSNFDSMSKVSVDKQTYVRAQAMNKCVKLQQYYYDIGANVDIKCNKLVDALVN